MAIQKYSESPEAGAAEGAPAPEEQEPTGEQTQEAGREDTFFISSDMLSKHLDPASVNPGDVLEFKVVGRDANGDVEVEYNTGGEGGGGKEKLASDLRNAMSEGGGGQGPGSMDEMMRG
jgi:hypothetical protein